MGATQSALEQKRPSRQLQGFSDIQTYTNREAASLFANAKDDRYCTEEGTISPLANTAQGRQNLELAREQGGVESLKRFYDQKHQYANQQGMTNQSRAQYVKQCYGKDLTSAADADPAVVKGMQVAQTNCGYKARYIRIWGNGQLDNPIQIAQLVVVDARGENVARGKATSSFSVYQWGGSPSKAVDGIYKNKTFNEGIFHSGGFGLNEFWEVDLGGIYDIVQIVYYNRGDCCQQRATNMKMVLYPNDTTPEQRIRDYPQGIWSTDSFNESLVQYFNLSSGEGKGCPTFSNNQRGDVLTPNAKISANQDATITDLSTTSNSKPVFPITVLDGKLDGPAFAGATYIWNEPYGGGRSFNYTNGCTFWTIVNNTTITPKQYTLYLRVNGDVGFLKVNRGTIPTPSTISSHTDTNVTGITLTLLPGNNVIELNIRRRGEKSFWAGSILNPNGTYTNQTNGQTTVWKSSTAPQLGTFGDSAVSSRMNPVELARTNFTSSSGLGTAKWIWNQPYAGFASADVGITHFYVDLVVSGTDVRTYTMRWQVDDKLSLYVNGMQYVDNRTSKWLSTGNGNPNQEEVTFYVVPGSNLIQVDCNNTGGPAGFRAAIFDHNGTNVLETSASKWNLTTRPALDINADACAYITDSTTNIPVGCAQKLLNAALGTSAISLGTSLDASLQSRTKAEINSLFTTDSVNRCGYYKNDVTNLPLVCRQKILNDSMGSDKVISLQGNDFFDKTRNYMNTLFTTNTVDRCPYYKDAASGLPWPCYNQVFNSVCGRDIAESTYNSISGNPDSGKGYNKTNFRTYIQNDWASRTAGPAPQIACRGQTVCPDGYTYNANTQKCEQYINEEITYGNQTNRPLKSCYEFNYTHRTPWYCAGNYWTDFREESDGRCHHGPNCVSQGGCRYGIDCGVIHDTIEEWRSKEERLNPCPSGSEIAINDQFKCFSGCPAGYSTYGNQQCRKDCAVGFTRQADGRCLQQINPRF